jgi:hypothetical protein
MKYIFILRCLICVLVFPIILLSCKQDKNLFRKIDPAESGITFNNQIIENDTVNVIDLENVYNGGGIAAGDFNNDGLQDLYFTGNLVANKLYLNKGAFKFEDISTEAGVDGQGHWSRGVTTIDINNDGRLDLYVSTTIKRNPEERRNLLYVNTGNNEKGIPLFKEMATEYGIADTSHSTMSAFFDYDNDGDLDLFIANNAIVENDYPNRFRAIINDGSHPSTDRLYRNNGSDSLGHPYFTNVSKEAGILWEGYSHAINICDINLDGWKDIYISNDYLSGNILYINNHDGTFTNKVFEYFKHGSANAMGNDVVDVNNDGLSDLIELDMNPEDNFRKKMMMNPNSYQTYQNIDYFNYHYQYVRNSLQINQGWGIQQKDSSLAPVFAELGYYAGIAETDWSWTPSVADFDNDGLRDVIITNGFPRDVTDHDFIAYRNEAYLIASKTQLLEQIPAVKISNYGFRNMGDLRFQNVSKNWGLVFPSFTNGAIYVDLDNDGDLDFVTNNINDPAFLFENKINNEKKVKANFLKVKLNGDTLNKNGLGTWVELYYNKGNKQALEYSPYRGYLSSVDPVIHFGLDSMPSIDSLVVKWPGGKKQTISQPAINTTITCDIKNANENYNWLHDPKDFNTIFTDYTAATGITYRHTEKDFVDFNIQKLLPHKLSQYGPALAVGDINGDQLDDLVIGGSRNNSTNIFVQQANGKFSQKQLFDDKQSLLKSNEDMGILLFDADNDNDLDLYCASGTYENLPNTPDHRDQFWVNDGKGNFVADTSGLPVNYTSKSCVKAADFDHDGDLDIFIGGRVLPGSYPKPVSSFIYRNDSKPGAIKFTDITGSAATPLKDIGLVCDALWSDFDNDGWVDLILSGEWMPVTFLKNNKGIFTDVSEATGLKNQVGWWNSIAGGDIDNDGDIDYVVGNLGLNSFYKGSDEYPVSIYAKDFDNNGSYDAIPSVFIPDVANGIRKEYPAQTRDDLVKQVIGFRQKFPAYQPFAVATMDKVLTEEERKDALILKCNQFQSSVIINLGGGKFQMRALPAAAQFAPVNAIILDDFNQDENLDILLNSNDFGTEVTVGRYDAMNGLLLLGNGDGGFTAQEMNRSGIFIPGDGKALVKIKAANGGYMVAASQNKGPLKFFLFSETLRSVVPAANVIGVEIEFKNGKKRKVELYSGSSFLSQNSRTVFLNDKVSQVSSIDVNQKKTILNIN